MANPWLILETSGRAGCVGVADGEKVLAERSLDGTKRHNRDLIPLCAELLAQCGFAPKSLSGIMVGLGPGSYTGLRVGLTAAKALALATDIAFIAVPTFHTLAVLAPIAWPAVEVIADALQGTVYHQRFGAVGETGLRPTESELRIVSFDTWKEKLGPGVGVVIGSETPQLRDRLGSLPDAVIAECRPRVEGVVRVGQTLRPLTRDEWFAVEPLYLRGSSAEEKAKA